MVSRCLARTQRHHVAMGTSPSRSHQYHGHTCRFCLLSDLTMKTNSYSRQTSHISTCTCLQNKLIYIPVKNKINKTNDMVCGSYAQLSDYSNISNLSQVSLCK